MTLVPGGVRVRDQAKLRSPATDKLAWQAVLAAARTGRQPAGSCGSWAGHRARPASINDLYLARGRGECGGFTVPAINVRMLAQYDTARAIFRAARAGKAGAIILEIARSEIAYTEQRPAEYVAVMIAAALREGYALPLFIQGDHCQVNHKKYQADPEGEVGEVKKLIAEEVGAGSIASTWIPQRWWISPSLRSPNSSGSITNVRRDHDLHPAARAQGVTVSVGAEIGEVGMKNSTVEELHAFMQGYNRTLASRGNGAGISKISVQTGTHTAVSCFRTGASRT